MDRRRFHRNLLLTAIAAPVAGVLVAQPWAGAAPASRPQCRRMLTEYELPPAAQTHELIKVPGEPLVVVSQMSNSNLVKLRLDPATEQVTGIRAFPLGPEDAMLHGLAVSTQYPGLIWATHEADNRLLLVDPRADDLARAPEIVDTIYVPDGEGPHYVGEYGDLLWVSLKKSGHVLTINHTDPDQYALYEAEPNPIFVARHPDTGEFYASQDRAGKILRIDPTDGWSEQIEIPETTGETPVGLVAGPAGLWVVLLGTTEQGSGTFGRIDGDGEITWFTLTSPVCREAGLLHIAFDPPGAAQQRNAWLLGSSIISPNALDMIIRVTFDEEYTEITSEEVAVLPTQQCKAHRLLPLRKSVLVTELTSATVAQLVTTPGCGWDRPTTPEPTEPS